MDVALWRPRSPAEHTSVIDGGDLGGARVCRGAWRYAPLPQREVGNLAPLRRSRICRAAAFKVRPAPAGRRSYTNRHAICLNACGTEIEDIHPLTSGSAVSPPLDHHPHPRQLTHCQLGEGVEATGRCRKPLWATDGTLWRPRSPAELISVIDGGDLGVRQGSPREGSATLPWLVVWARQPTPGGVAAISDTRYEIRDTRYEIRDASSSPPLSALARRYATLLPRLQRRVHGAGVLAQLCRQLLFVPRAGAGHCFGLQRRSLLGDKGK